MIRTISIAVLCQLLILQPVMAQQASVQRDLRVVVVQGANARNVVQQIAPKPFIVRVEDDRRAVQGATVVFTAPQRGPSGEFINDSQTISVLTDQDGVANAGAYHPNATAGPYQILVTVQYRGATGSATISQMNIPEKGHGKLILTLLILGAAGGAAVAYRNKLKTPSSSTAPTIGFGGAAVGAPK